MVMVLAWLLWLAPASLMASLAAGGGLQLQGVSGSFWSGSAESARLQLAPYKGRQLVFDLGEFDWQLQPAALLTLRACAQVQASLKAQQLKGQACQSLAGTTRVTDVRMQLPASFLRLMVPVEAAGQLQLAIDELQLSGQQVASVTGSGRLAQFALQLDKDWQNFGSVDLQLQGSAGSPFLATLTSEDQAIAWRAETDQLTLGRAGLEAMIQSELRLSESYRLQWGNALALLGFEERDGAYYLETRLP